ncbi:MAG: sigma-70 family RNA polymerase sigma factor, partial [Pedobacter sp.]
MVTQKISAKANYAFHFGKFREGNESGLAFFYNHWYPMLYYSGVRYIKDDVNAACIVNEAFLRLWLFRDRITESGQIEVFIKKLAKDGYKAYFRTSSQKFQRNLLRLDDIENYQEFIGAADAGYDIEEEVLDQQDLDEQMKAQWARVTQVIPNLTVDQQMFIRLCIKYSFDYDRVAWHIGGISSYEVARKVEKTLVCLKAIITDSQKLDSVGKANNFKFEGDVCT